MVKTLALVPLLVTIGCSFANVGPIRSARADWVYPEDRSGDPEITRIVLDQDGDLAPRAEDHVVDGALFDASGSRLSEYFRRLGLPYEPTGIAAGFAGRINAACGPSGTLVILIHGINNTYDEARRSYKLARMQLRELTGRSDLRFLEVYWDGRTGDPLALWPAARETSKWAGLGLRPLLRALDPGIAVRVVTHSRGAAVIASALWNLPLREGEAAEKRFAARQAEAPAPDARRARVAMIVPAMPGEDFDACPRRGLERLIVGVNPDDQVVGKGLLPATWFGSTDLGSDPEAFERHVKPVLNGRAVLADLSNSPVHDFKEYLLRRAFEEEIVPLLFQEDGYQERSTPAVSMAP
jgi:hypothetical protein